VFGREPDEVVVEDAGAPLRVGEGCVQMSTERAFCRLQYTAWVALHAELLDGDDVVRVAFASVPAVWGGVTSADPGTLSGGAGNDYLEVGDAGEFGFGKLPGGPGDDVLISHGPDLLEGGGGNDRLAGVHAIASYADARTPVHVDLSDRARDGRRGEADTLTGVDDLLGGAGDDLLVGNASSQFIVGNGGDDRIRRRAGDGRSIEQRRP
jgi:Ca2+-binding RTX toxin-like protein